MNPQISILVPVYNVEPYLKRCLDSIVAQSFTDYEVILVDDGSTDLSSKICDEYAEQDKRFHVFHRENNGISATREFAVNQAKGSYIQFVDSDDWIEPDMLLKMYQTSIDTKADIIACNFIQEYSINSIQTRTYYDNKDAMLHDVIRSNWGVLWKLLIKHSLIINNSIHFPKGIDGGEDYYYVVNLLIYSHKVTCIDEYLYHYNRSNESSFISKTTLERVMFQVEATKLVEKSLYMANKYYIFRKDLDERKCSVKCSLLKLDMLVGSLIFEEINWRYLIQVKGKGNKLRFVVSQLFYIVNKLWRSHT